MSAGSRARDAQIDAYLFDLDGTLIDTETLWEQATVEFLRTRYEPVDERQVCHWVHGRSWHDIYGDLVQAWPELDIGVEALDEILRPHFLRLRRERDVSIRSSLDLLLELGEHSPVVIVSGSTRESIEEAVRELGIADRIAFFLGSSDYAPGKPDPACFLKAAERLGADPSRCVVFEDSTAGIQAGRRAGMMVVALARPGSVPQQVEPADWVLPDLSEFTPKRLFDRRALRGETR